MECFEDAAQVGTGQADVAVEGKDVIEGHAPERGRGRGRGRGRDRGRGRGRVRVRD